MAVLPRANMPAHSGIRIVSAEKERVVGEIDADERHLNGRGVVQTSIYDADEKLVAMVTQTRLVIARAPTT